MTTKRCGMAEDSIAMQDIFIFARSGIDENGKVQGLFRATGSDPNSPNAWRPRLRVRRILQSVLARTSALAAPHFQVPLCVDSKETGREDSAPISFLSSDADVFSAAENHLEQHDALDPDREFMSGQEGDMQRFDPSSVPLQ